MLCLGVLATTPVGSTVPGLILAVMAVQLIVGRGKPGDAYRDFSGVCATVRALVRPTVADRVRASSTHVFWSHKGNE
jgi:hypothetical protein